MSVVVIYIQCRTYPKQYLSTGILLVVFRFTVIILEKCNFSPGLKGLKVKSLRDNWPTHVKEVLGGLNSWLQVNKLLINVTGFYFHRYVTKNIEVYYMIF